MADDDFGYSTYDDADAPRTKIRLIVDKGEAKCPSCGGVIHEGWGHGCTKYVDGSTSGRDFKLGQLGNN